MVEKSFDGYGRVLKKTYFRMVTQYILILSQLNTSGQMNEYGHSRKREI